MVSSDLLSKNLLKQEMLRQFLKCWVGDSNTNPLLRTFSNCDFGQSEESGLRGESKSLSKSPKEFELLS